MAYLLCFLDIIENEISNPTTKDFEKAVASLKNNPNNFLTYESTPSINRVQVIQATDYDEGYVHVEVLVEGSVNPDVIRAYGKRMTEKSLLAMLIDFKEGIIPDIDGWEIVWSN